MDKLDKDIQGLRAPQVFLGFRKHYILYRIIAGGLSWIHTVLQGRCFQASWPYDGGHTYFKHRAPGYCVWIYSRYAQKMKILVLMKRFGANKDMVMQDFGRQIRLFENLSFIHSIDFLCMDYRKGESKKLQRKNMRYYIEPFSLTKVNAFLGKIKSLLIQNRYDMIVAS